MRKKFESPSIKMDDEKLEKMSFVSAHRSRILGEVTCKILKDSGDGSTLDSLDPIMKRLSEIIQQEFPDESYHVMAVAVQCVADALLAQTFDIEKTH